MGFLCTLNPKPYPPLTPTPPLLLGVLWIALRGNYILEKCTPKNRSSGSATGPCTNSMKVNVTLHNSTLVEDWNAFAVFNSAKQM